MARISAGVTELVNLSKLAGFSLPDQFSKSYEACTAIQGLTLEPLNVLDVETGAEQIVATAIRGGEPINLSELGRSIQSGTRERAAHQAAQLAQQSALERAGDPLITHCPQPDRGNHHQPFAAGSRAVLDQAKKPAEVVRKHAAVTPNELRLSESEAAPRGACSAANPRAVG